jgi:hypothetical protein
MPEVTGVLVKSNECRAVVRLDRPERDVEFTDQDGQTRQFKSRGTQVTSWAPTTLVEPVSFQPLDNEENDMSKAKKTTTPKQSKATSTKAGRDSAAAVLGATINAPLAKSAKAAGKPKEPKADGKLSCIDAAAKVLAEKKAPMTTKEMIEAMAAKGLWSSPNGQTPAATLYSAILREINTKGKDARFVKADRGKFEIRG